MQRRPCLNGIIYNFKRVDEMVPTERQYRFLLSRRARCHACTICYGFPVCCVALGLLLNGKRLETTPADGQTSVNFSGYLATDSAASCFAAKYRLSVTQ